MAHLAHSTEPIPSDDLGDSRHRRVPRHRLAKRKKGSFWRELPILVLTALALTFLIQTFVARVYVIPSASMEPTLHGCTGCTDDRVLVDKLIYRFRGPRPGEVVVFRGPESWTSEFSSQRSSNVLLRGLQDLGALVGLAPPDERDFVKRVIAVGGQTVQCCDQRNRVMVDGRPLTEPYAFFFGHEPQEEFGPVTVPRGDLWMMGDNRNDSADSRRHGPVPVNDVIGKARFIVLPVSRWRVISDADPQQATALGAPGPSWPAGSPPNAGLMLSAPVLPGSRRPEERLVVDRSG